MINVTELEDYISQLTNENGIDHSVNLFEGGFLSSLDVLDLINFIEMKYDLKLSEDDMTIENLGTINNMVGMIERLKVTQ